jgi:hypothetical protein
MIELNGKVLNSLDEEHGITAFLDRGGSLWHKPGNKQWHNFFEIFKRGD